MLTIIAAAALGAAQAPATPAAHVHPQQTPAGQAPAADKSGMDHSKMDHSKMGCCKHTADGKMECTMPGKAGAAPGHQGHSGH